MKLTRRHFLHGILGAAGSAAAGAVYATKIEPHWVDFNQVALPIRNLPAALVGKRLVQMSDLHIGLRFDYQYILETFPRVEALAPDFVVYTGDFVSYEDDYQLEQFGEVAPRLPHGRLGTAAVLGNHDYGHGWQMTRVADILAGQLAVSGVTVLRNEQARFGGLTIVGLDEYWSPRYAPREVLADIDPDSPALTLVHNPDVADEDVWGRYRGWILCGHTHGGQVKPPFLPPPVLPVRNKRYTSGKIGLGDGRTLYINRALGHLWSIRFNARPEVTVFTLQRG